MTQGSEIHGLFFSFSPFYVTVAENVKYEKERLILLIMEVEKSTSHLG